MRALSERRLKAKGLAPESSRGRIGEEMVDIGVNKRTGEIISKPVKTFRTTGPDGRPITFRPDPGWSYNPGAAAYGSDIELLRKITAVEDAGIRAQAIQAINNSKLRHAVFASWVDQVLTERKVRSSAQVVGIMDDEIADAVRSRGQEPTRIMGLRDRDLLHADRRLHHDMGVALTPDEWRALPSVISTGDVYWDVRHKNIVYAVDAGDRRSKIIVEPSRNIRRRTVLDAVINAYKVSKESLGDPKMFDLIRKGKAP